VGIHGSKLGRGIQNGIGIDSRNRTTHNISRNVTAGTTAGNSNRFQPSENLGKLFDP